MNNPIIRWLYLTVNGADLVRHDVLELENGLNNSGRIIGSHVQPNMPAGEIRINYSLQNVNEKQIVDLVRSKGINVLGVKMFYDRETPMFKWFPFFTNFESIPVDVPEALKKYIGEC